MRSKDRKHENSVIEVGTQLRLHVAEQLQSRDTQLNELKKTVAALQEDIRNLNRLFPFHAPFDTNGLLYWIGTQGGRAAYQNPHVAGYVVASPSSVNTGSVADFVGRAFTNSHTNNAPFSWMAVDLGAHRSIMLTHYCLRTRVEYNSSHSIRSWEVEGGSPDIPYELISKHTNDTTLSASRTEACWKVRESKYYRHFRLKQTGPNSDNLNFLINSGIEFYGHVRIHKINTF